MPFKFAYVCDLLQRLEDLETADPPLLLTQKVHQQQETLHGWFRAHRRAIDAYATDRAALLSALLPERRTDRVYGLQELSLSRVLGRCLGLGSERLKSLYAWDPSCLDDFAQWVARLQAITDSTVPVSIISVETIDNALEELVGHCRFSSPEVRAKQRPSRAGGIKDKLYTQRDVPDVILRPLVQRMQSRELKWFIRLILKKFGPVSLDERLILKNMHFLLPRILRFQSSFEVATQILRNPLLMDIPAEQSRSLNDTELAAIAICLRPRTGIKVGRPEFLKARSIKHCLTLTGKRQWNIEPKYDGEYCQIHVDLTKGRNCIQIFSKSGKDSTRDKAKLHGWIKRCLRIGTKECKIRTRCILEGEMVVYSDKDNSIMEFSKIRKHVPRSGTTIGTAADSQPHESEHLMIVFFDALLIDEDVVMHQCYSERRRRLRELLLYFPGRAQTADWGTIDFSKISSARAARKIGRAFAKAIASRCEGLILKPSDGPYFSIGDRKPGCFDGQVIKLKKDYIPGLGDTADFVVLGASYVAADAQAGNITGKYTHFAIGCMENKEDVLRFSARPLFRFMGMIGRPCVSPENLKHLASLGQFVEETCSLIQPPSAWDLIEIKSAYPLAVAFKTPFIVEVLGAGFEKPSNTNYYMLRFPRIVKIHHDRSYEDVVSFDALQVMGKESFRQPDNLAKEEAEWLERIVQSGVPKRPIFANTNSPFEESVTNTTKSTLTSPAKTPRKTNKPSYVREDTVEKAVATTERIESILIDQPACSKGPGSVTADDRRIHGAVDALDVNARLPTSRKRRRNSTNIGSCQDSPISKRALVTSHHSPSIASTTSTTFSQNLCGRILAEITNTTCLHPSNPVELAKHSLHSSIPPMSTPKILTPPPSSPTPIYHTAPTSPTTTTPPLSHAPVLYHSFTTAAFYLAPCISTTPYVHDLLHALHKRHLTPAPQPQTTNLAHWQRDPSPTTTLAFPPHKLPPGAVVAESQAYVGLRKTALVESRRAGATAEVVERLRALRLRAGEQVDVWDWRGVEALVDGEVDRAGRWFLGSVIWEGCMGGSVWMPVGGKME